jgi:pimeloyl-ACP methyl ester carboxylesterase
MPNSDPILIVGGFGLNWPIYQPLQRYLAAVSGRPVEITTLRLIDWLGVVPSDSYGVLLGILDRSVREALRKTRAERLVLVAHSAGGVLARIYLGDQAYGARKLRYNGFERVSALVTLGTPHSTTKRGRQGGLNQIAFAEQTYPGAYWRFIRYISVMGRSIYGDANGPPAERGAFQSYALISGVGAQWGDGVVPLDKGLLAGARPVVLEGLRHDPRPDRPWYGQDEATVAVWWREVESAEREPTQGIRSRGAG